MKNSIKKVLAFMLAILFALSFVGCAEKEKKNSIVGEWEGEMKSTSDSVAFDCRMTFKSNGEYIFYMDEDAVREMIVVVMTTTAAGSTTQIDEYKYDERVNQMIEREFYQELMTTGIIRRYSIEEGVLKMEAMDEDDSILEYNFKLSGDKLELESIKSDEKYVLERV